MFEVLPSGIHGLGLFATQLIPADAVIGQLHGTPTTDDGPHVLWLSETQGLRVENDLRYINHDDEPNAAYYDDLTVAAICDIQPGQEITHDYRGDDEFEPWGDGFEAYGATDVSDGPPEGAGSEEPASEPEPAATVLDPEPADSAR